MHMALAERLSHDSDIPETIRRLLGAAWGAFLLGSIAPDARLSSGLERADTHFFRYGPVVDPPAVTAMLRRYGSLRREAIANDVQAAYVAGYAAHLAMDETWCVRLLFPYFTLETLPERMRLFHMLIAYLDRRDRAKLTDTEYMALASAVPNRWLPFISDQGLIDWRDTIASQIAPAAPSRTLDILGQRVSMTASELAGLLDSEGQMEALWALVSPSQVASIEEAMYSGTRRTVVDYLT